jgi:hypothetical protein
MTAHQRRLVPTPAGACVCSPRLQLEEGWLEWQMHRNAVSAVDQGPWGRVKTPSSNPIRPDAFLRDICASHVLPLGYPFIPVGISEPTVKIYHPMKMASSGSWRDTFVIGVGGVGDTLAYFFRLSVVEPKFRPPPHLLSILPFLLPLLVLEKGQTGCPKVNRFDQIWSNGLSRF